MQVKDYYQILGVARDADEKAIKAAYRKLARKHHPDVNPGDAAAESRFKDITEAHEVLSDPAKRQKYDRFGQAWKQAERTGQDGGFDWSAWAPAGGQGVDPATAEFQDLYGRGGVSDLFEALFGARGGAGRGAGVRPGRGRDLEQAVTISLEEAYGGGSRLLSKDGRRVEVKIPAGVKSAARIRLRGEGLPGPGGGAPGDLFLVVEVQAHPRFERQGDDLHLRLPLPLSLLVLGGEAPVPTLDGGLSLTIPPETQNGRRFRLRGKGMPRLGSQERGDLYVSVEAQLPTKVTDAERELFVRLRELGR
ncbi:MAG: J domain-containing protein [Ardenticatenia bacterium]|nr:J domain-containing protein [Ardenticatenia bacterium]